MLPVCLYGSENWILTDPLISTLEDFQAELGKKILNIPKHHSNLIPLIAMCWPSMRVRILHRKLGFLWRLIHPKKRSISVEVFESLREKNLEPLVVQQCKFLEQVFDTSVTTLALQGSDDSEPLSLATAKQLLLDADREYYLGTGVLEREPRRTRP